MRSAQGGYSCIRLNECIPQEPAPSKDALQRQARDVSYYKQPFFWVQLGRARRILKICSLAYKLGDAKKTWKAPKSSPQDIAMKVPPIHLLQLLTGAQALPSHGLQ